MIDIIILTQDGEMRGIGSDQDINLTLIDTDAYAEELEDAVTVLDGEMVKESVFKISKGKMQALISSLKELQENGE